MFISRSFNQSNSRHQKVILIALAGILATSILSGCGKEDMHGESIQVYSDAKTLTGDYDNNAVSADASYKGRVIEVTGVVDKIDTILGKPSVTLRGSASDLVQCDFNDDTGLAGLSPGQTIKVKGHCNGAFIRVAMSDCVID